MSAAPTPIRECDAALDYLYGMLEGEAKARFETHLATCARCQAELAAFGRVREIAKAALPPVEPSERLTGALHAQLLHAAAQRKPRGKVLPFMRRVFRHPAYAAAAGILIIGGAVGVEWSRGKLLPPTHEVVATDTVALPQPAGASTPGTTATPTAAPVVPAESAPKEHAAAKDEDKPAVTTTTLALDKAKEQVEKRRAIGDQDRGQGIGTGARRVAKQDLDDLLVGGEGNGASVERKAPARPAPTAGNTKGYNGLGSDSSTRSAPVGGDKGGASSGAGNAAPMAAKKVAPAAPPALTPAPHKARAEDQLAQTEAPPAHHASRDYEPQPQSPRAKPADEESRYTERPKTEAAAQSMDTPSMPTPAPVATQGDVVAPNNYYGKSRVDRDSNAAGPAPNDDARDGSDAIDNERNRGTAFAQAGRCEEAVTVFKSIERRVPSRLTPQDRLSYERCLRTLGRLEPAQNELNQMRNNNALKSATGATLQAEQKAIDLDRKRQASSHRAKAKKTAPAATTTAPANADIDNSNDAATKQQR